VQQGGVQSLTRAGNFQLDPQGNLTTVDGESVMGYQAVNGALTSNGPLAPLQLPVGSTEAAQATQNFSITANLNAGASGGMTFSTPVTIYDSLGQSQIATVTYTKSTSVANTWGYAVTLPAGVATGTPVNNTGTLTFDSSGNLISPSSDVSNITFPGMSDGASDLTLNWNLFGGIGKPLISQTTAASTATGNSQDGFPSGVYQSFAVDPAGIITASYSNGNTTQVGQIAVATVANMEGLTVAGNNNFTTTGASGLASIGVAGSGGRGTIQDDELELSNVDISTEFANLIVAQRAFEANSKTMTTFDTISQDAIGMIR
jgi:flagellar hook protein FlgE